MIAIVGQTLRSHAAADATRPARGNEVRSSIVGPNSHSKKPRFIYFVRCLTLYFRIPRFDWKYELAFLPRCVPYGNVYPIDPPGTRALSSKLLSSRIAIRAFAGGSRYGRETQFNPNWYDRGELH